MDRANDPFKGTNAGQQIADNEYEFCMSRHDRYTRPDVDTRHFSR
jgi:hypothetical protein